MFVYLCFFLFFLFLLITTVNRRRYYKNIYIVEDARRSIRGFYHSFIYGQRFFVQIM